MTKEEIIEMLKVIDQSIIEDENNRRKRVEKFLETNPTYYERKKETEQLKSLTTITAKANNKVNEKVLIYCPICEIKVRAKSYNDHLDEEHSTTTRKLLSEEEYFPKNLLELQLIQAKEQEEKYPVANLTSKGRVKCCKKFRSQELHKMHLKVKHNGKEQSISATQKVKSNYTNNHILNFSAEELKSLIAILNEKEK